MLKNLKRDGRKPVVVVRIKKSCICSGSVDFTVYDPEVQKKIDPHVSILGVIPAWLDENGIITSIETGQVVTLGDFDQIREVFPGTSFRYKDGTEILYTRNWERKCYYITEGYRRPSEPIKVF